MIIKLIVFKFFFMIFIGQFFWSEIFNSRERRKSRYLSYPYTNMGPEHSGFPVKTEDSETPSLTHQVEGSDVANRRRSQRASTAANSSKKVQNTSAISSAKKLRSKWCRKHIRWSTMFSNQVLMNESSSELLFGLYSKALDCNFPYKNGNSDLMEWFFSSYRLSTFRDEAELAAILENRKSGNTATSVKSGSLYVSGEQEEKKTKPGQTRRCRNKPLASQSDMNKDIAASEFLSGCSAKIKNTRPGESLEDVKPALQPQNVGSTAHEGSSRTKRSRTPRASRPRKTKKITVVLDDPRTKFFPGLVDGGGGDKSNKSSSFVIDLQMVPPPSSVSENNNEVEIDLRGSQPLYSFQFGVGNLDNGFSPMDAPAEHLKTKHATVIPDLNDGGFQDVSIQKKLEGHNGFPQDPKSKHKQRLNQEPNSQPSRSISSGMEFMQSINYNKMEANGSCLLLHFNPGKFLPSKDDIFAAFCQYGPLNVAETQVSKDGHAQVAFLVDADAEKACCNLKQNRQYRETLSEHNNPFETSALSKQCEMTEGHSGTMPPHCDRPSLDFIRQNLEMMASVLEKKGHTISLELKDKLGEEIKNLMEKVKSIGSVPDKE